MRRRSRVMRPSRGVFSLVVLAAASASLPVHAEEPATRRALAEALFRQGRERLEAKAYAQACPKLAESQRLDPRIGTLMNLAFCHAQQGRTATAWGEYAAAAADAQRAGRKDNEAFARGVMKTLETTLSRVTLAAVRPPADLAVKLDGAEVGRAALGSALPLDPGPHTLEAAAAGRRAVQLNFEVAQGPASATITVPELPLLPPAERVTERRPEPAPVPPAARSYTMPIMFGGVAVASAVVGSIFGLEAFAKNHEATVVCPTDVCTAQSGGLGLDSTGHTDATVSTIAFVVAGAAAATAIVWLVVDKPKAASVTVGFGPGRALMTGTF